MLSCARFISFVAHITIFKLVAQQRYANSKKSRLLSSLARRTFLMLSSEVAQGLELRLGLGLGSGLGLGFLGCRQRPTSTKLTMRRTLLGKVLAFVCFSLFALRTLALECWPAIQKVNKRVDRDSIRVRARWQKQILVFGMHKKCANKA